MHEDGGEFGSIGYRYPWREAETSKLVLRTHTTAVSAAMLYEIANQPGGFRPCKLFSIDRVFRNETVDATHLAEFHQVEGVVADENITLGDLIGFMEVFFRKMGLTNLKFKVGRNLSRLLLPIAEPARASTAGLQPVHRALIGDLRLPSRSEKARGDRQLWHVPTRDARTDGTSEERASTGMGAVARAPDDDQVRDQEHQRSARSQGTARDDRKELSGEILIRARQDVGGSSNSRAQQCSHHSLGTYEMTEEKALASNQLHFAQADHSIDIQRDAQSCHMQ